MAQFEEKQTDSRIAALVVADAMADRVDTLILIAGDSDHVPAVEVIREQCPQKNLLVCWPPRRKSDHLKKAIGRDYSISEAKLRQARFPDQVRHPSGATIECPAMWTNAKGRTTPPPPLDRPSRHT